MTAKKTQRGELSRQNLLNAASRVFRRRGYGAATVRDIAKEAGVALGGLYRHFPSKEHFIAAVLADGMREIHAKVRLAIDSLPAKSSLQDRVAAGILAQALDMQRRGNSYDQAVRYERTSAVPAAVWKRYRIEVNAYRLCWKALLESAQAAGQIRRDANCTLLSFYVLGSVVWISQWYRAGGRSLERISVEFASYFIDGARARDPAEPRPTRRRRRP